MVTQLLQKHFVKYQKTKEVSHGEIEKEFFTTEKTFMERIISGNSNEELNINQKINNLLHLTLIPNSNLSSERYKILTAFF